MVVGQSLRFQSLSVALVAPFVFSLSALVIPISLTVHLQLARQLHDNIARLAVGGDEPVHHAANLVKPNVNRRVGYAPIARRFAMFVRVAPDGVSRQDFSVVRQRVSGVGVSEVGVMIAGGFGGFRVDFAPLQVGKHAANRLLAKVAVSAWERCVGDRFGMGAVQSPIRHRLVRDLIRVFGFQQKADNLIALR